MEIIYKYVKAKSKECGTVVSIRIGYYILWKISINMLRRRVRSVVLWFLLELDTIVENIYKYVKAKSKECGTVVTIRRKLLWKISVNMLRRKVRSVVLWLQTAPAGRN